MQIQTSLTPFRRKVDVALGLLLRIGVLVCAAVIALGWAAHLVIPAGMEATRLGILTNGGVLSEGTVVHSLQEIAAGLSAGQPLAVVLAGLILLIALPFLRVALTAVAFAVERDWLYVGLASLVLALLISGLFMGKAL